MRDSLTLRGIAVINADGTGQVQLTNPTGTDQYGYAISDFEPAWSPLDGKIAFCSNRSGSNVDIWEINPDGTGLQQVTTNAFIYWMADSNVSYENYYCYLRWSPDGKKFTISGDSLYVPYPGTGSTWNVYSVNADGSNLTQLTACVATNNVESVCSTPSWSPDGTEIAFSDQDTPYGDKIGGGGIYAYIMKPDGSSSINPVFQSESTINLFPQWSTDGKKIIFTSNQNASWGVWSANPDGTGLTQVIGGTKGYKYSPYGIDCRHCPLFNQ